LIPYLEDANLILTIEPNAPQYGADYLTKYQDSVELVDCINSNWIKTQIDTGCAIMVNDDPIDLYKLRKPSHIHLSSPNMAPVPSEFNFKPFLKVVLKNSYSKWLVIEMLSSLDKENREALGSAKWLIKVMREIQNED
jgi:sugar phosphate isomerase/epimerase